MDIEKPASITSTESSGRDDNIRGNETSLIDYSIKILPHHHLYKRRSTKACDHCRKRKIRCDDVNEITGRCPNCTKFNVPCTFIFHEELQQKKKRAAEVKKKVGKTTKRKRKNNKEYVHNYTISDDSMTTEWRNESPVLSQTVQSPSISLSDRNVGESVSVPPPYLDPETVEVETPMVFQRMNNIREFLTNGNQSASESNIYEYFKFNHQNYINPEKANELNEKLIQIDRKVKGLIKYTPTIEKELELLMKRIGVSIPGTDLQKPTRQQYTTLLFTTQNLLYIKRKLFSRFKSKQSIGKVDVIPKSFDGITTPLSESSVDSNTSFKEDFMPALKDIFSIYLKYHVVQMTKVMEVSSMPTLSTDNKLYDLLTREQALSLIKSFQTLLISSSIFPTDGKECSNLIERYYHCKGSDMNKPELLLINMCLCLGAQKMRNHIIRKNNGFDIISEELLLKVKNVTLLNSVYFFHKTSSATVTIETLQGLLLLTHYIQIYINTETAAGVFMEAVNIAFYLELHLQDSYEMLNTNDLIKRRVLWMYCFSIDKYFSLILSRPPLIRDQNTDVLAAEEFFAIINSVILPTLTDDAPLRADTRENREKVLNIILGHYEFLPIVIGYFKVKLVKIELLLYDTCFSVRSTIDNTFDETIDKILEIKATLEAWRENLPSVLKLENYIEYINLLHSQIPDDNTLPSMINVCCSVLNIHFRYYYLVINLSLFTNTFLADNKDLWENSRHNITAVQQTFHNKAKDKSIKVLQLFLALKYDPDLYSELSYYLLTALFVILLYVVKCLNNTENNCELVYLINLLTDCHTLIIGEDEKMLVSEDMKWNMSIFFFTFLLHSITKNFKNDEKSKQNFNFKSKSLSPLLVRLVQTKTTIKEDILKQLEAFVSIMGLFKEETGENNETLTELNISAEDGKDAKELSIFTKLNTEALKILRTPIFGGGHIINCKDMENTLSEEEYFKEKDVEDRSILPLDLYDPVSETNPYDSIDEFQDFLLQGLFFSDRDMLFSYS
ncbi:Halotolerance protein 9 [Nakaseomyces bracarensis]|uniref:Halotolerance protein 9 n=1 Tax=Nakaseomyces bracarensis TaxID=273131 RepID=A0ABR4NX58_9SACH